MNLLLLFLPSHWQCMAAPSLKLTTVFHLGKGIEKQNTFWCACTLSVLQRHWHFTAAFFPFSPSDNYVRPSSNFSSVACAFLQIPAGNGGVVFPSLSGFFGFLCGFSLCQPVVCRTFSGSHSWAQVWMLWVWTSSKSSSAAGSKCAVEQTTVWIKTKGATHYKKKKKKIICS